MKKMLAIANDKRMPQSLLKTAPLVVLSIALGSGFWIASIPIAQASPMTPAEMIQKELPPNKTIATSTDAQLLDAVCKAVKKSPKDARLIVRTAAGAHNSLKTDILCMTVRCLREKHALDCTWILDVLRDWIKTYPDEANHLTELVSQCAPDCRDAIQNLGIGEGGFTNPPTNINAPPGSVGGASGGNVCIVCHNRQEIQIACSDLDSFLRSHPGDTAGPCQPTPVTNR